MNQPTMRMIQRRGVNMNYGYIDKKHILEKAEKICDCIGHGLYGTAVEMIVETAIAER